MRKYFRHIAILSILSLFGCNNRAKNTNTFSEKKPIQKDTITRIVLPEIPAMMTNTDQRADFLVRHYWNHLNFADTNYIHHPEITEQAWTNYCDLLTHVPLKTVSEAMHKLIEQAGVNKKVLNYMSELADKYLYDPNSPMRNEEFYIPILEGLVESSTLEEVDKIRPKARLELAQKNRIGTKALDFIYTLQSGTQGRLYQLTTNYVLIFINNPGCHACAETINQLKAAPTINDLLNRRKLTLLSIYPDDEIDEWTKHLIDLPNNWINGYDKELKITDQQLYDLKAIPTLYLVDKSKTVILKDVTAQTIEEYLSSTLRS